MSNRLRASSATRILSLKTGERDFGRVQTPPDIVIKSPPLLAGTPIAGDAHAAMDEIRTKPSRAMWLLAGWLTVSGIMIAIAIAVIVKYF
ncbi:hypothetical protein [Pseudorhodoplanes sp.]|uniref:hypothetical protein n=1 Tax=Pseudorhodoplanes sp. TaxID=1934341 RepID=UPI002B736C8A|nr:hypothetical protein [Pseudorhodoplanes sp.]HWV40061.1 hypothetical protein [Pseudorhodoplanes sp.]